MRVLTFVPASYRAKKVPCGGRRRRRWKFLKKHWAYVLGFIVAFIFALIITRIG